MPRRNQFFVQFVAPPKVKSIEKLRLLVMKGRAGLIAVYISLSLIERQILCSNFFFLFFAHFSHRPVTRENDERRPEGLCAAKGRCYRHRRSRCKHIHHHRRPQDLPLPGEARVEFRVQRRCQLIHFAGTRRGRT